MDDMPQDKNAAKQLSAIFECGRIPAAILIVSENAIDAAKQVAASIVCEKETFPSCGVCKQCKKSRAGIHPDIIFVSADKASISVEQIRQVRTDAHISPNDAARKVYIIEQASDMTEQAQNAFLKILEQPPKGVYFVFADSTGRGLLGTLCSRLAPFRFPGSERRTQLRFLLPNEQLLTCVKNANEAQFLDTLLSVFTTREQSCEALEELIFTLRDIIVSKYGMKTDNLPECAGYISVSTAIKLYDAATDTLLSLENSGNVNLSAAAFAAKSWEAIF